MITERLARYSRSTSFAALPDDVVDYAKRVILDTLGCMVLGSTMQPGRTARKFAESMAGAPQATVIGAARKLPAPYAALVNGTAGHADELDGVHKSRGHQPVVAVAACLAMAEQRELGGQEFINAVVLSFDIGCRLVDALGGREALMKTHHVHTTGPYAVGAGAAAARLAGLDQLPAQYALALAAHNIFAPMAFMNEREHMTKAMTHGQAAFAGVTGALLAGNGFGANDRIVEAEHGLLDAWRTELTDAGGITAGLGERFAVTDTAFKHYSAGYPMQAPLSGALELMRAHGLTAAQVEAVRVGMPTANANIVDGRPMPSICLQDMMGVALVRGQLRYEDAHDSGVLAEPEVRRLRERVEIVRDPVLDADPELADAAWVEILAGGTSYRAPTRLPPGNWAFGGMPWPDVRQKFIGLAGPRLGHGAAEKAARLAGQLETLPLVSELTAAFALS